MTRLQRAAAKLARELRQPVAVLTLTPMPERGEGMLRGDGAYAQVTLETALFMAHQTLSDAVDLADDQVTLCEHCVRIADRARRALAILSLQEDGAPRRHVH